MSAILIQMTNERGPDRKRSRPRAPTGLCTGFHGGGARSTVPLRPPTATGGRVHTLNDPTGACASGSSKNCATISRAVFPGPGRSASLKSRDAWRPRTSSPRPRTTSCTRSTRRKASSWPLWNVSPTAHGSLRSTTVRGPRCDHGFQWLDGEFSHDGSDRPGRDAMLKLMRGTAAAATTMPLTSGGTCTLRYASSKEARCAYRIRIFDVNAQSLTRLRLGPPEHWHKDELREITEHPTARWPDAKSRYIS